MKKALYMLFIVPVCILSMLSVIYLSSKKEPLFFLQNVKINGAGQLNEKEIMAKVSPYLKESLFSIDITKIRDVISASPLVKDVRIKRVYPFSIVIDVKEKTPSAIWISQEGDPYVLDEFGDPYRKLTKGEKKGLCIINAKEKAEAKKLFKEINGWAAEGILRKEKIFEAVYHEGGLTIFGFEDPIEIILGKEELKKRLQRAMTVLGDAKKRGLVIKCIDARFEKGAIIQERKG